MWSPPIPDGAARPAALIVDDELQIRRVLARIVDAAGFRTVEASSATNAREKMARLPFELMLVDVTLPDGSGLDLIRDALAGPRLVAVVMVSGITESATAEAALELGAYGYVIKPFRRPEILISIASAMRRLRLERENLAHLDLLERTIGDRTAELEGVVIDLDRAEREVARVTNGARDEVAHRLAKVLEFRDLETARHTERVARYAALLARADGAETMMAAVIAQAASMHDIGKVGIPDAVLRKPGALDEREISIVRLHPSIGRQILSGDEPGSFPLGAEVAFSHHERWDGGGYPQGLAGEAIPHAGRIASIADVFDSLTSARVWRPAFSIPEAVEAIRAGRGHSFDPRLVDLFLEHIDEALEICETLRDPVSA